ncbi:MAG: CinA family protein [Clostridia bacterium]|nr:CinA family protein [Clostridia bacterium]
MEEYRNYCVIKTFGVTHSDVSGYIEGCVKGVEAEFCEDCLDGSLLIVNKDASEVDFQSVVNRVTAGLKDCVYADYDTTITECFVEALKAKGETLGVAESLTGGMICSDIVSISGASAVLSEGVVTYTNSAKVRRLHVKSSSIEQYGAVSRQVAEEMAQGVLANRDITVAIATTGCAGPDSDERGTPVGEAYIAVASREGYMKIYRLTLDGDRNNIRRTVANAAQFYALKYLDKDKEL